MLFSQCQPFKDCSDNFGGLCRFELILELSIGLRLDLPGRTLVIEFEQDDKYFRVEVNSIAFCKDARYAFLDALLSPAGMEASIVPSKPWLACS